jgi:hypothetical protein
MSLVVHGRTNKKKKKSGKLKRAPLKKGKVANLELE